MGVMIEVQDLTKYYGPQLAISRLDFQVAAGEIVGFLGDPEAWKTTTLKILAGYLAPSAGTARINGHDCVTDSLAVRRPGVRAHHDAVDVARIEMLGGILHAERAQHLDALAHGHAELG